jgi:ribosomal RNA-processing protein 36
MSLTKRKALDDVLQRRVRARREPSEEIEEEAALSDNLALNSNEHSDSEEQDSDDEVCKSPSNHFQNTF